MGLVIRDDPPKVIDLAGREWGEPVDGLALSIRALPKEDPRQPAVLSVVIRNAGPAPKSFTAPGWMFFYRAEGLPLSAYGAQLLKPERRTEKIEVTLGPGEARETDLPVGALYEMRRAGDYPMRVSCELPDGQALRANLLGARV